MGRLIPSTQGNESIKAPSTAPGTRRGRQKYHCYYPMSFKRARTATVTGLGFTVLLNTCGSWELDARRVSFLRLSCASWPGQRTHLSPRRRAECSAAKARGPWQEVGRRVGLGVGVRGMDCLHRPLPPQTVSEAGLAAAAAEPSGLGTAQGPARPPRS